MSRRVLIALLLCGSCAVAQTPPAQCFGFNSSADTFDWELLIPVASPLRIRFTAPVTATVDQISVFESTGWNASTAVAVHAINPLTGFPVVPPLSSAPGGPYSSGYGWQVKTLTPPVSIVAGTTYVLALSAAPTSTNLNATFGPVVAASVLLSQQSGSTQLPYTGGSPNPLSPGTGGFKFSFNGTACAPRLAELRTGGPSCGGATPWQPLLFTFTDPFAATGGRPLLGVPLTLGISTGATVPLNAQALLFWSIGSNLGGAPLGATSPCSHWLDPLSLGTLGASGAEPLATAIWATGSPTFQVPIPPVPSFAGTSIAVQCVIVDPAGVPSGVPGLNVRLTNSLVLLVGF